MALAPPTIISFTCSPTTLPAGGGLVTFNWVCSNDPGDTTFGLFISPDDTVCQPVTIGSTTINVVTNGIHTLTATNFVGSTTAEVNIIIPTRITVNGLIFDGLGGPMPANTVGGYESDGPCGVIIFNDDLDIIGQVTLNNTNAFTIENVPVPYNLYVFDTSPDGTSSNAHHTLYYELTNPNPYVIISTTTYTNQSTTVAGNLIGGVYPETGNYNTQMQIVPNGNYQASYISISDPIDAPYSFTEAWSGPDETITAYLYGTQLNTAYYATPLPSIFYFGQTYLSLTNGIPVGNTVLVMNKAPTGLLTGSVINLPSDWTIDYTFIYLDKTTQDLAFDSTGANPFSYMLPVGMPLNIGVTISNNANANQIYELLLTGITIPTPSLVFDFSRATAAGALNLVAPANGATGVSAFPTFVITPLDLPAVYYMANYSHGNGSWTVYSPNPTYTIPNFSLPGGSYPPSAVVSFYAEAYVGQTTDQFTTPLNLSLNASDALLAISYQFFTFTIAP